MGVFARLGAGLGWLIIHAPPTRWTMGPRSRWWETLRRVISRLVGRFVDERAGPRPITEAEYAGTLDMSVPAAERLLWDRGFRRNPFARLKTRDGVPERGSWAYWASPLAERQLHLSLFPAEADGVDVYAHAEPSSVHPFVGADHFSGRGQDVAAGVAAARERLPLEVARETPEPPAGPWSRAR